MGSAWMVEMRALLFGAPAASEHSNLLHSAGRFFVTLTTGWLSQLQRLVLNSHQLRHHGKLWSLNLSSLAGATFRSLGIQELQRWLSLSPHTPSIW